MRARPDAVSSLSASPRAHRDQASNSSGFQCSTAAVRTASTYPPYVGGATATWCAPRTCRRLSALSNICAPVSGVCWESGSSSWEGELLPPILQHPGSNAGFSAARNKATANSVVVNTGKTRRRHEQARKILVAEHKQQRSELSRQYNDAKKQAAQYVKTRYKVEIDAQRVKRKRRRISVGTWSWCIGSGHLLPIRAARRLSLPLPGCCHKGTTLFLFPEQSVAAT
jgi:RNA polymerase-binding transcription factor DksA